jgi:Neuraminidase (sialidase)
MNSPKWGRSRRTTETTGTTTATTAVTSIPFHAGREGYASFRIPAVVVTRTPTLLAFCEGRVDSAADHGHIDIVLRRSTDGGRTWRPAHTVDGLPAAYSDLVRADGATVGLLYEMGDFGPYETITFRRIPMTALT